MGDVTVRWATVADLPELVRLRRVMFDGQQPELRRSGVPKNACE